MAITREKAEATVRAIEGQFKSFIEAYDGRSRPILLDPDTHADDAWSVAWEDGPDEWAYHAFAGGIDEEVYHLAIDAGATTDQAITTATVKPHACPTGVYVEAYYSFVLCLYPAN
jgi:hypothetical protein